MTSAARGRVLASVISAGRKGLAVDLGTVPDTWRIAASQLVSDGTIEVSTREPLTLRARVERLTLTQRGTWTQ